MRAYVFADTLGRTLTYKGYKLTHVINITDVGHLTDDADAGEDKLEKAAQSAERLLGQVAQTLAPKLLEVYGAVLWEDQDECLEVRPEDVPL